MRTSADIHYVISDERLLAYAKVPLIDRLRWLDELVRFTQMWRAAPTTHVEQSSFRVATPSRTHAPKT